MKAIVHAHAAELVLFSIVGIPLRPTSHMGAFIGAGVPVFELRPAREPGDKSMLIHTPALGKALARTLDQHPAVLIRGHGGAIVGSSLGQAVARSIYLQQNAAIQRDAISLGGKVSYIDADEARAMGENNYYRDWEVWRHQGDRRCG